ncbi:acylneuraminate cytidylyltransferase family protein [Aurantivibrio infirmus]
MTSRTVAFIFARGGSKGIPRKNIKNLCGKPLIAHSIEVALNAPSVNDIYVSTEDEEISEISSSFGAKVIPRPMNLAKDDSSEWKAWRHAIKFVEDQVGSFDKFVSLPATSPLRSIEDVESAILGLDENSDIVVTVQDAARSPYFNMVNRSKDGFVNLVINRSNIIRRQDAPECYDLTTVAYVSTPKFILNNQGIFSGRVKSIIIPKERAVDIDDEFDFAIAEYLMAKRDAP